jgi:hypothetical protein
VDQFKLPLARLTEKLSWRDRLLHRLGVLGDDCLGLLEGALAYPTWAAMSATVVPGGEPDAHPCGLPRHSLRRSCGSAHALGVLLHPRVVTRKVILGSAADDGLAPTRPDTKKAPSGLNSLGVHGPRRTSMWWSRGESNPRPQAIPGQIYTLSSLIWISRRRRAGARYGQRQSLDLVQSRVTQLRTSRCA